MLIDLPWWPFAVLFAIADGCVVTISWRGQARPIPASYLPLVIGLFLVHPLGLVLARLTGGLLGHLVTHRHAPGQVAVSTALSTGGTAAALLTFTTVLGSSGPSTVRGVLAGVLAAGASGLAEAAVRLRLRSWFETWPAWPQAAAVIGGAALRAAVVGAFGVVSVLAIGRGQAALPLAAVGAAGLAGYQAYVTLSARHASLERLYELSGALAAAPGSADVVQSVLSQSTQLLRARYAEVMLEGLEQGTQLWSVRAGQPVYGPVEAGAQHQTVPVPVAGRLLTRDGGPSVQEFLAVRHLGSALIVPFRVDGPVGGHLVVGDRVREEGPFRTGDVRLLETVANHASIALRNGQLIERLHFEARHDELTGLPNRLDFRHHLEAAAARAALGEPCAVMVLDFNGFKAINDSLGHQAGDELLRVLGCRFEQAVRGRALVARLGGDEFAVLAPNCADVACAQELADAILGAFDEQVPVGTARLRVGGSLGISLGPDHGTSATELLRTADLAMYAAKAGSGGRRLYTPEMVAVAPEVLTLATDLREAVAEHQISTVLHPVVDLVTGAVHSVEVLARWTHPRLGEVAPDEFFDAAERSGQVAALSEVVLDQALATCRTWLDQDLPVRMAVNLAPRWLAGPGLPELIAGALRRHRVPAGLLCLEITERSVIAEPQRITGVLTQLRAMGVHLSVDDFGTGYSSLTQLSRLPVDQLKIDRSFIGRLRESGRDRAIVQSIIDLGRNLGLEVVAEGIADAGARQALQEMGCALGQGYLFGKPMTAAELEPVLHSVGVVLVVEPVDTLASWPPQTPLPPS
jgi:diguanylate cyclase (GGDEF)-like protein